MSLCVSVIFYLIVCCVSVIWALLPEINVMVGRYTCEYHNPIFSEYSQKHIFKTSAFHTLPSPAIFTPAISTPTIWCHDFHSSDFHYRVFSVPHMQHQCTTHANIIDRFQQSIYVYFIITICISIYSILRS